MRTLHEIVRSFWNFFDQQKWDQAQTLLHADFVAQWPQSREKMVGPRQFIEVNRYYPGNHRIQIIHLHQLDHQVITTVWIESDDGQKTYANSYFEFKDDLIYRLEEYWAAPYPAPSWRQEWVELY